MERKEEENEIGEVVIQVVRTNTNHIIRLVRFRLDHVFYSSLTPTDPNTIAWIANNVDSIFGYPNIARFSWQTVKTVLGKSAADVRW